METTTGGNEQQNSKLNVNPSNFEWIMDDNLLRDEGTFYGLSDFTEEPVHKIRTIESFFDERIAVVREAIEGLKKELDAAVQHRVELRDKMTGLKDALVLAEEQRRNQPHHLARYTFGILSYGVIVWCNFILIYNWLQPAFLEKTLLVTIGLYCFASFSLFNKSSILYRNNREILEDKEEGREPWKVYAEEFGIPVVTALFIVLKGTPYHTIGEGIVFFLLIFTLFVFAGKAFLSQMMRFSEHFGYFKNNFSGRKKFLKWKKEQQTELHDLEEQMQKAQTRENEVGKTMEGELQRISVLEVQKKTYTELFLSEFHLAKATRQFLSQNQTMRLVSNSR